MIDGVYLKRLTVHSDDRGILMEVLRADDPCFGLSPWRWRWR